VWTSRVARYCRDVGRGATSSTKEQVAEEKSIEKSKRKSI